MSCSLSTDPLQEEETLICDVCKKAFTTKQDLDKHVHFHLYDKLLRCGVCGSSFTFEEYGVHRLRGNCQEKQFNSGCSDETSVTKPDPTVFPFLDFSKKRFLCMICNKTFKYKSYLTQHAKTHFAQKQFKCEICDKGFSQKSVLLKHQKVHIGEKPFECGICFKKFVDETSITRHLRIHTGEKPFTCGICEKDFRDHASLWKHKKNHTGETPFECGICRKRFVHKATIKRHLRVHTGEKPFSCEICGKAFGFREWLKRHLKTHKCKACNEPLKMGESTHKHEMADTCKWLKQFRCVICESEFSDRSQFMEHLTLKTCIKKDSDTRVLVGGIPMQL